MNQLALLGGNAWRRLTRIDGLARNADPRSVLTLAAIAFGAPGIFLSIFLALPVLEGIHFRMVDARPVLHQLAWFSALLIALAALLEWDALLPDASDAAVLAPLPVTRRSVMAAHAGALAVLLAFLTAIVNAGSLLLIPSFDATHMAFLAAFGRQLIGIIITAVIAFGSVLLLRALGILCADIPGLRWLGSVLQLAGLVGVIAALLLLPTLSQLGPQWQFASAAPLPLAGWAAALALAAAAAYLLAAYCAFRPARYAHRTRSRTSPYRAQQCLWGVGPRAAATRFALRTLMRCSRPRTTVGAWLALGAGIVMASFVSLVGGRLPPTAAQSARAALGVPLVLGLFLLTGLRGSFAVPVDIRANWVFRICAQRDGCDVAGAGRQLMFACLAVLVVPTAIFAFWSSPPQAALMQFLFLAVAGPLWVQCLNWRLRKIPFTCSYQPGGANLAYLWPLWVLGCYLGGFLLAGWEQWLLADAWRLLAVLALMLAVLVASALRHETAVAAYQFEDEPDPVVQTLFDE